MLPLHGQGTAAVEKLTGQDGPTICAVGGVFDKQAGHVFAEFLIEELFYLCVKRYISRV